MVGKTHTVPDYANGASARSAVVPAISRCAGLVISRSMVRKHIKMVSRKMEWSPLAAVTLKELTGLA